MIAHADLGELLVARFHFANDRLQRADDLVHVHDDLAEGHVWDSAKADSSTRFGSIITKRTSSGFAFIMSPLMIEFMQTLLPQPVAPAMSRWGIFARSATIGTPETPLPRASASFAFERERPELFRLHHRAHRDHRGAVVWHLDADDSAPGHRRLDPQARRRQGKREVVLERRDPVHPHARPPGFDALLLRPALGAYEVPAVFVSSAETSL